MKRTEQSALNMIREETLKMQGLTEAPYARLQLAQVIAHEQKEGKYTGRVDVELLSIPGVRKSVLAPAASSQYWFSGGLPPVNTLCLIGWLPMNVGIIIQYYMYNLQELQRSKDLEEIVPGELLMKSQVGGLAAPATGAQIYLNKAGEIVAQDKTGTSKVTLKADGSLLVEGETINVVGETINVTGDEVLVGDADGKKLVTEDFLDQYDSHTHATAGTGPPSPPVIPATNATTEKTKAS